MCHNQMIKTTHTLLARSFRLTRDERVCLVYTTKNSPSSKLLPIISSIN